VPITVVGTLEADLPGAIEYKEGGVGPLFQTSRSEEGLSLLEFLSRSLAALKKLGIEDVITCYVDDVELFRDADDDERAGFDIIREAAAETITDESGVSFHLMLSYEDKQLSHIITVEASIDHPADEAPRSSAARWNFRPRSSLPRPRPTVIPRQTRAIGDLPRTAIRSHLLRWTRWMTT
jgi:hypothetical protein